ILADVLEVLVARHSGGLGIARRHVDLKVLCERVLDAIQPSHPECPLRLVCTRPVLGSWDPDRVASLLLRLVKNAIQHGALRRTVTVSIEDLDDRVLLEVKNFGPSLHRDVTDRLFEPFVCGDADPGNHRGLGVGLYLAKEIVTAHGGSIEARSEAGCVVVRAFLPRLPVHDSI
ncbi:MAG TPA: ATP-binding protein, partial [Polyangiaceae bacterium]|nr:ATP-binding protein [Polyangiaceae bacterium]